MSFVYALSRGVRLNLAASSRACPVLPPKHKAFSWCNVCRNVCVCVGGGGLHGTTAEDLPPRGDHIGPWWWWCPLKPETNTNSVDDMYIAHMPRP